MLCLGSAAHVSTGLFAAAVEEPPPDPRGWMLPVCAVAAIAFWYMHWRWRAGRYFMSRFTTPERETAKLAQTGHVYLPAAIASTAGAALLALWTVFGLVANVWFGYLFLLLATVFMISACWTVKEFWWPTERRTPDWARRS